MTDNNKIKVVLTGDTQVGKTSLASRFTNDLFEEAPTSTIFNATFTKTVNHKDQDCYIEIWDTAGQEQYATLAPLTYRGANAILMLFALNDENTLEKLGDWENNISTSIDTKSIVLLVVGTKSDTLDQNAQNAIMNKAKSKFSNIDESNFFITSAKDGSGINEMFYYLIENHFSNKTVSPDGVDIDSTPEQKTCC